MDEVTTEEQKPFLKGYLTYGVCAVVIIHALTGGVLGYLHMAGGIDLTAMFREIAVALAGIGIRRNL